MNPSAAQELFRATDRELWLVTSRANDRRGGLIATFVNQASIVAEAPRVLVGIAKQHHTWSLVEDSGTFALHLLGEEHLGLVWRFGLESGRDRDKLDGLSTRVGSSGSPIIDEALGWLDCRVEARLDTGDRTVYLAEVLDARPVGPRAILTVRRLLELATDEQRTELRRQMDQDSAVDRAAIDAWRRANPRE
jgi:flavin reductase (DIM6/NTAB) family NADH-FMN oxidoreductase RutF